MKLEGFIEIELTSVVSNKATRQHRTYQAEVLINKNQQLYAGRLDGFWLLATNHTESKEADFILHAKDAINPYREKVIIEDTFRDIKSFVAVAPVYVWTEEHVKAHYTICVLAHLINRTITKLLNSETGRRASTIISHQSCYKVLRDCKLDRIRIDNHNLETLSLTKLTDDQAKLLQRLKLPHLINDEILKIANKSIGEVKLAGSKNKQ